MFGDNVSYFLLPKQAKFRANYLTKSYYDNPEVDPHNLLQHSYLRQANNVGDIRVCKWAKNCNEHNRRWETLLTETLHKVIPSIINETT